MSLLRDIVKGNISHGILVPKLDAYLLNRPADERRVGYHPSELSYGYCPRELVMLRLGWIRKRKTVDARMNRVFDNGHHFHNRMKHYAREMQLVYNHPTLGFCEELQLDHPCGMTGNCDNILFIDGRLWVVDYKSIKQEAFNILLAPLDYHVKQVRLYLGMLLESHQFDYPIDGLIFYENKNDQSTKEFVVHWNSEAKTYFDKVVSDLNAVNDAVSESNPYLVSCTCGKCNVHDKMRKER